MPAEQYFTSCISKCANFFILSMWLSKNSMIRERDPCQARATAQQNNNESSLINMADITRSRGGDALLVTKEESKQSWVKAPDISEEWCRYRLLSSALSLSASYKIRLKRTSLPFTRVETWKQLAEWKQFASLYADPRGKKGCNLERFVTLL